ncbi:metallophosphoesterase [Maribacter sp. 2210JD10-5]|uniref:metallophosphoesterase n=1 Tax=Maribacter sp. 2210JD10-5 TaxID=3386272 RepID=UPI0039BCBEDB
MNTINAQQENSSKKEAEHAQNTVKKIGLNGRDGPYIINDTLYRVNSKNQLLKNVRFESDSIGVIADNEDSNTFYVSLKENYHIPPSEYEMPNKLVVISDIEGKYDAFACFLYSNKVIDENHDWIFGKGHLILVGDFVDRGKNVTQVLWLIYKLEQEALASGGQVHFILGNHEVLNFKGDYRYNREKYINVAREISGLTDKSEALKYLYSNRAVLGEWLATKNVIEKIGEYLFVHAGLSPELLDFKLSLEDINHTVRQQFHNSEDYDNSTLAFLYSSKGPFWYRGLVLSRPNYSKIEFSELEKILTYYDADKIIIGHTPVRTISTDYEGKVIRTDVAHGIKKFSGKTKGLLIKDGVTYIIDDKGKKMLLR